MKPPEISTLPFVSVVEVIPKRPMTLGATATQPGSTSSSSPRPSAKRSSRDPWASRRSATLRPPCAYASGALTHARATPSSSIIAIAPFIATGVTPSISQEAAGSSNEETMPAARWSHSSAPPPAIDQKADPPGRA
ncbi:MAG: hypothetical protein U0359_27265 [Byssovorax sp.]